MRKFVLKTLFLGSFLFACILGLSIKISAQTEVLKKESFTKVKEAITNVVTEDKFLEELKEKKTRDVSKADLKKECILDPQDIANYVRRLGVVFSRRKEGLLTIAGKVTTNWVRAEEKLKGTSTQPKTKLPINRFKTDTNVFLDYKSSKQSWLSIQFKWIALAETNLVSSSGNVERAFFGKTFYEKPKNKVRFFGEIGRSDIGFLFDSKVQFSDYFDGIHLYYSRKLGNDSGLFIIHGGPFVVNMGNKQYGWVGETVVKDIVPHFTFKYSLINWGHFRYQDKVTSQSIRYGYIVSQGLLGYSTSFLEKNVYVYGAALVNSSGKAWPTTRNKNLNQGYYWGVDLGGLKKARDWLFSMNYEYVEAMVIPEIDVAGIGRGNYLKYFLTDAILNQVGAEEANGFTNYKGWRFLAMLALTSNLSGKVKWEYSRPATKGVGRSFSFTRMEMALDAAF